MNESTDQFPINHIATCVMYPLMKLTIYSPLNKILFFRRSVTYATNLDASMGADGAACIAFSSCTEMK